MTFLRPITLLSTIALLSACANNQNFGSVTGPSQTFAQDATDTYHNRINDGGVSGKIALQDSTTGEVRVADVHLEVSSDYSTATLTIGGNQYTLTSVAAGTNETGGLYTGTGGVAASFGTTSASDYVAPLTSSAGGEIGSSFVGRETPVSGLPSAMASYSGVWSISDFAGTLPSTGGTVAIDVDFAAASSQVDAVFSDASTTGLFGTLSADLLDNGFIGILLIDGNHDSFSGDLNVHGTFYGPAAEQVAGVISGDVTHDTAGSGNMIGAFAAE